MSAHDSPPHIASQSASHIAPPAEPPTGLARYADCIDALTTAPVRAKIVQVIGLVVECSGLQAGLGECCRIYDGLECVGMAEVVGFRRKATLLMPLDHLEGVRPGMEIVATGMPFQISVGKSMLGRILNGLGEPIDGKGPLVSESSRRIHNAPPDPLQRRRIESPMTTGIRSIDGFRTIGKGQRMGIFAGSGVGKSVLMGMIARNCTADINVIALIGERGREVKEFLEKDLGPEGLKRSVVVVATSDQPAVVRIKAALVATTLAEYFRDEGADVMLMMDSSTRLAMAQREIGLAIGEPPATRGYTPSVFAFLPRLFERAGMGARGSITGLYTVLVEGDDMDEPVADAVRSILDGHIVLSRDLAHRNHYPAVDVLKSVSRCMKDVTEDAHRELSGKFLKLMAAYAESEDMINLGAYVRGTSPLLDQAVAVHGDLERFLVQPSEEFSSLTETLQALGTIGVGRVK